MPSMMTARTGLPTRVQRTAPRTARRSVAAKAEFGFLGGIENKIMCASTAIFIGAGRAGLAPTAARTTGASEPFKLNDAKEIDITTNDPAGFTWVDVVAFGSLGHIVGAAVILGVNGASA